MWSIFKPRPLGNIPMRRLTLFVSATFVAMFALLTLFAASVEAQAPVMATWSGENLEYKEEDWTSAITLTRSASPESDENIPDLSNTDCKDNPNIYYSQPGSLAGQDNANLYIICLGSPFDGSDKTQTIPAIFLQYSAPSGTTEASEFGNPGYAPLSIAPEGTDALGNPIPSAADEPVSNCTGDGTIGIGWVVCPLTRWIATGMDTMFIILKSFLTVAPLSTDTGSPLYAMWNIVRNLANILFIIGFLLIIYSQITNFGLSNYGLKRLLPRLVIAAILVNVSYWISAVAVDLSNILGSTLYEILTGVGKDLQSSADTKVEMKDITWQAVAGVVLSGGAAGAAAFGIVGGVFTSAGASLWLLLISLMGVLVSALVAILLMAARQALITILIVISPLAFVAYLLPSTEKHFDRWRSFFTTLLLLFPIFAVIFGGAQLAGMIIIYGAIDSLETYPKNPNFFNLIILGLIVQVAPVLVTPMLIKFGGSLLGRIAGIANDPNKGLIDRTRKFAQNRHDMTKNRQLWDRDKNGNLKNRNPLAATGRWNALREENSANKLKAWQGGAHAEYERNHKGAHDVYAQNRLNEMIKSTGDDEAKAHFAHSTRENQSLRTLDTQQRLNKEIAEVEDNTVKTAYEAIKTRPGIAPAAIRDLANQARDVSNATLDEQQRQSSIQLERDNVYWRDLASDAARQSRAGAEGIAEHGETRIANIVRQKQNDEREKRVSAAMSNLSVVEATLKEERAVILGDIANAGRFVSLTEDVESRAGALRRYVGRAPIEQVQSLLADMDITISATGDDAAMELRSELAGALQKRKPFYVSQTLLSGIEEGSLSTAYYGVPGQRRMIQEALDGGALSVEALASKVDRDDLKAAAQYLSTGGTINAATREQLRKSLKIVTEDNRYSGSIDKRKRELGMLWDEINPGAPRPLELQ